MNVPASDVKWVEWLRVARNYQLRVGIKDTWKRQEFDGFTRQVCSIHFLLLLIAKSNHQDQDSLTTVVKTHLQLNLETKELSWRGWNWGTTDFRGMRILPSSSFV